MDRVLVAETQTAGKGMAIGFGLMVLGFWLNISLHGIAKLIAFVITLTGVVQFSSNFGRLLKVRQLNDRESGGDRPFQHNNYSRRTLSRQVMALLMAVAEVDGAASREERGMVQRFLLERFFDWELVQDLRSWRVPRLPEGGLMKLARNLAGLLGPEDREALFHWSCLVTLVDQRYTDQEHQALQVVARGFGLDPHHARKLFLDAKARAMTNDRARSGWGGGAGSEQGRSRGGWDQGGRQRQGQQGRSGHSQGAGNGAAMNRAHALQTLGLPPGASADDIRKRHRELVKQHHPDRTSHLGEIARRQATERFTEIQEAYELLTRD